MQFFYIIDEFAMIKQPNSIQISSIVTAEIWLTYYENIIRMHVFE